MVMEAQPSPQSVGREFVRQYYTLLNKAPDHLHRFYNNSSSFVHGGLDTKTQEATLVIGQKQIHNKIQQLNFRDCHAKISQVDSQATLGNGVVVQVTGELSNDGQPMRRFTQTFVLAAQSPKKYYVHNDIFRYQDVYTDDEIDENDRSGGEDEGDTDAAVNVDSQTVPTNAGVAAGTNAAIALHQQQQPQQQLYYPPGVMNATPTGIIPSYGQPQQQLNGVHEELLKTVPPQTAAQIMQTTVGHPSVGTVPPQNQIIQQVPPVAAGIPTVDSIQHLTQQQLVQSQPTPSQLPPQQVAQHPQQSVPQQHTQINDPEPITNSLAMNELDSALSSINDPTPAEASDAHDHHLHGHGVSDVAEQTQVPPPQQPMSNEPKTYANLVKSGGAGVGGSGSLSFASVSSHHQQQSQQQLQHHQQGYGSVSSNRQPVLSPPPSSIQNSSSNSSGPGSVSSGLGSNKYDRPQNQDGSLGSSGPMPQRIQSQQRPIRGNGGPSSGSQNPMRQQEGRPSYQRSYNDGEERRPNPSQYGDNHQLFVGNIPHHATEEELKQLFGKYGTVVDLHIHSKTGQKMPGVRAPPNYTFVTFEDPASVQDCLANMPLYFPENSPDGQKLNVEEKKTRMRGPGETGGRIGSNNLGGNGSNGPRGGPGGPGQQRGGPGGPQGNLNRGGSGQRGLGGVGAGGGSGRGGYRGSVSGGQRSGNGNVSNTYGGRR